MKKKKEKKKEYHLFNKTKENKSNKCNPILDPHRFHLYKVKVKYTLN
jgi:hypothetical protein